MKQANQIYKNIYSLRHNLADDYTQIKPTLQHIFDKYPKIRKREQKVIMAFLYKHTSVAVSKRLLEMPYNQYLQTIYWHLITLVVRSRYKYSCSICGNKSQILDTHHLTYTHRSVEYKYMDDLVLVCRDCHKNLHEWTDYSTTRYTRLKDRKRKTCVTCQKDKDMHEYISVSGIFKECHECRVTRHQYRKNLFESFTKINWGNLAYKLERSLGIGLFGDK